MSSDPATAGHEPGKSNGSAPPPAASDAARIADLDREARELLHPNPSALTVTGHMTVIPVVNKPLPHEFFRAHPTLRFTMPMVTPKKGALGAYTYAVLSSALPCLARAMIEPFMATLFPIVIAARPPIHKLVLVKLPSDGKQWDAWNLSKKLVLDEAVNAWRAMRTVKGGYCACPPNPSAILPAEVEFPDYSGGEWIDKSLGVADLIVRDETHPMFADLNTPRG